MNLPNFITIGRLLIVPLVITMIVSREWVWAFVFFAAAGVSDAVDGFIAKRWNMTTELGATIDPLADKALIMSMYVALGIVGALPVWLVILVVFRDVMIVGAFLVSALLDRPLQIRPLAISKVNTAAQIGLAALVVASAAFGWPLGAVQAFGILLVAGLTVASAGAYLAKWVVHMNG